MLTVKLRCEDESFSGGGMAGMPGPLARVLWFAATVDTKIE